jgi:restriction endonuclease S subunit
MSSTLTMAKLSVIADINPALSVELAEDEEVSFLPMSAVVADRLDAVDNEIRLSAEVSKAYTPFQPNDVLVAKITPCFENGKIAIAKPTRRIGFGSTEFHVVRAHPEALDPRYLLHFLRQASIRLDGQRKMTGSAGQRRVPQHFLDNLGIPLPPLPEQKRIAEILDKADALRAKRRTALAQLDTLTQSIFLDMFGDPATNPKGWATARLSDLCNLVRGSSPRPQGDPRFFGGPVPRLMVADITRDGWSVTPKIDSLTVEGAKHSRPVPAGTVVMAVSGNIGLVSQLAVDACVHDGFVAFTELNRERCEPEFLMALLHFSKTLHEKHKAGAIFINLTTTDIKAMSLPIPPRRIQSEFTVRLQSVNELKEKERAFLQTLDALFASIQQRAFRGEL